MIRWPWTSRAVADAREAMLRELIAGSKADWKAACARYDALLDRHNAFVALVAERTAPAAPVTLPPREKPEPPDPKVTTAIDWMAQGDPFRRRYLERFARQMRAEGRSPDDVARAILRPENPDDESWNPPAPAQ